MNRGWTSFLASFRYAHPKEAGNLSGDHQPQARKQHLGKLNIEHEIEGSHMMLAHELVLVGSRAPIEAERHEQKR